MGLLDPNLFTNPVLLNQLKGLLGNMPMAQLMRGEAEVSREGLLGEMRKIPVFDPSVSDEFMGNAMNAMTPFGALTFAGIGAKTANKAALKAAEGMEAAGKPRDAIWSETGWFRGPDKKWRFEIDDSAAGLRLNGPKYGTQEYTGLGETLDHPGMFKAYPDAKGINVSYGMGRNSFGRGGQSNEYINLESPGQKTNRSTMLHELQHALQQREGFSRGGNPDAAALEWSIAKDRMDFDTTVAALAREAEASTGGYVDEAARMLNEIGIEVTPAHIERAMRLGTKEAISAADESTAALRQFGDLGMAGSGDPGAQIYRRLAGEAEARAVQARMDFPMDKRRAIPPWESYDIPWDQLIVR